MSSEDLPFIKSPANYSNEKEEHLNLSILLSFWLAHPGSIYELVQSIPEGFKQRLPLLENGLLALFELGYPKLIDFIITIKYRSESGPEFLLLKNLFEIAIDKSTLAQKLDLLLQKANNRLLYSLISQGLTIKETPRLLPYFEKINKFDDLHIWALLLSGKKREPGKLLEGKSINDNSSLYYMLQGCYLASLEGEEGALAHFDTLLETPYPFTPTLLGHFLKGHIGLEGPWFRQAFFWEKIQLYKQLSLYYTCLNKPRKGARYERMIHKEFLNYEIPLNFI